MTPAVRTAWGIPQAQYTELEALYGSAEGLLRKAESSEGAPVITEQCREAFDAMTGKMGFFKAHYFLVPPLSNADLVNLGLSPGDPHPTPTGEPTAEITVEPYLTGRHELGIKLVYVSGNPSDRANKGYRIGYSVIAPERRLPPTPEIYANPFTPCEKKTRSNSTMGTAGRGRTSRCRSKTGESRGTGSKEWLLVIRERGSREQGVVISYWGTENAVNRERSDGRSNLYYLIPNNYSLKKESMVAEEGGIYQISEG